MVEVQRLRFDGTAVSLFGQWIKWFLLTLITFGIDIRIGMIREEPSSGNREWLFVLC